MEVIWTDMATQQLGNIVEYVESEFGRSIAVKTLDKINSKIIRLSHFPESGIFDRTMSDDKYTMRHIILDPNVIYYLLTDNVMIIIAIAHIKQSPSTVRNMIKNSLEQYMK